MYALFEKGVIFSFTCLHFQEILDSVELFSAIMGKTCKTTSNILGVAFIGSPGNLLCLGETVCDRFLSALLVVWLVKS